MPFSLNLTNRRALLIGPLRGVDAALAECGAGAVVNHRGNLMLRYPSAPPVFGLASLLAFFSLLILPDAFHEDV